MSRINSGKFNGGVLMIHTETNGKREMWDKDD